jgi:hypothetical protein
VFRFALLNVLLIIIFFLCKDDQLVVKQLANNWTVVEKDALLKFAPAYFDYMQNADKNPTVLAKIFGFYTIKQRNLATGVTKELDVIVMEHLFCNVKISRVSIRLQTTLVSHEPRVSTHIYRNST